MTVPKGLTMAGFEQENVALAALLDPTTSPEDLSAIVAAQPGLWLLVAQHPNAYPDLLQYLSQYGDETVKLAVAEREATGSQPSANDAPTSAATVLQGPKIRIIIIAGAACVLLICVALVLYFFVFQPQSVAPEQGGHNSATTAASESPSIAPPSSSPTPSLSTTPAPTPTPNVNPLLGTDPPVDATMTSLSLPSLPQLPLNPIHATGSDEAPNIQKYADDVAAGNVDALVFNCWTQPAEDIRTVYGSPTMRGAILQALQQPFDGAQGGITWSGSQVKVFAHWEEAQSNYPCPNVTWGGGTELGGFTPEMAQWRITRILGVQDGTPIHNGDGTNYTLLCDQTCSYLWNPHTIQQTYDGNRMAPIMNATAAQWDRLRALSNAQIVVEHIASGYYRVRAGDGSTDAVAYFTAAYSDWWLPYTLGEID